MWTKEWMIEWVTVIYEGLTYVAFIAPDLTIFFSLQWQGPDTTPTLHTKSLLGEAHLHATQPDKRKKHHVINCWKDYYLFMDRRTFHWQMPTQSQKLLKDLVKLLKDLVSPHPVVVTYSPHPCSFQKNKTILVIFYLTIISVVKYVPFF